MADTWAPPNVEILRAGKNLRDFVSWMITAPVVSHRAKLALEPITGDAAEYLPLLELRGSPYFAVNVIATGACVDLSTSEVVWHPERPSEILQMSTYSIDFARTPQAAIFKYDRYPMQPFVDERFIDVCLREELTGAVFFHPGENQFGALMRSGPKRSIVSTGKH